MRDYVGAAGQREARGGDRGLQKFAAGTGTRAGAAQCQRPHLPRRRLCTDNADVALASALVLVGLGEGAYDELVAYHLIDGFGTPERGAIGPRLAGRGDRRARAARAAGHRRADSRLDLLEATSRC